MHWTEIQPENAKDINLYERTDIIGPLTQDGEVCPWPWEPQQLKGVAMGMYHCPYCGEMCIAGLRHTDFREYEDPSDAGL
jgi:hypothetical protein